MYTRHISWHFFMATGNKKLRTRGVYSFEKVFYYCSYSSRSAVAVGFTAEADKGSGLGSDWIPFGGFFLSRLPSRVCGGFQLHAR